MWLSYKYSQFFPPTKRVDFDAIVDHLDFTHIIKSKAEPATTRKRDCLSLLVPIHLICTT